MSVYNQIGGNKPAVTILKGISIVPEIYDWYFNPIYGFLMDEITVIRNYRLFGNHKRLVTKLVRKLFHDPNLDEIILGC